MAKIDCPECGRHKSVSSGDHNGRHYKLCHACGWREVSAMTIPLRPEGSQAAIKRDLTPHDPSADMLVWLGRYGVSWSDFSRHGGFASRTRLVFKCTAFTALRACSPGQAPKWLVDVRVPLVDVSHHTRAVWGWWTKGGSNVTIICEDSLGAFKAYLAGFNGFPLLGTAANRLDPRVLGDQKILVLTDPDDAGRMAGQRLQWRLRGLDVKVVNGKEPKEYTLLELQSLVSHIWNDHGKTS